MQLLSSDQIEKKLQELDVTWTVVGGQALTRVFTFESYSDGLAFVNTVANQAEEHNHHPEILFEYGKVTVSISTHSAGGLTEKDFTLAKSIDKIKDY